MRDLMNVSFRYDGFPSYIDQEVWGGRNGYTDPVQLNYNGVLTFDTGIGGLQKTAEVLGARFGGASE